MFVLRIYTILVNWEQYKQTQLAYQYQLLREYHAQLDHKALYLILPMTKLPLSIPSHVQN